MKRLASKEDEEEDHDHKKPKLAPSSNPSSLDDEGKEIVLPIPELFADLQLHFERARLQFAALMAPHKSFEEQEGSAPAVIDAKDMIRHRQRQLLQRISTPSTLVLNCNSKWFKIQDGEATTLVSMEVEDRREIIGMCVSGSDEIIQVVHEDGERSTFVDRLKFMGDNLERTEHVPVNTSVIERMMEVASDGRCLVSWCASKASLDAFKFARFYQNTKDEVTTWDLAWFEAEVHPTHDLNTHAHLTIMNDAMYTVESASSYGVASQTIGVHPPQQHVIKLTVPRPGIEDADSNLKLITVLANSIPMLIGPGVIWVVQELAGQPKPQLKPMWVGRQDWDLLENKKNGYAIQSAAAAGEFVWVLCRSLNPVIGTIWIVEINLLAMTPQQPRFIQLPIQCVEELTWLFALQCLKKNKV